MTPEVTLWCQARDRVTGFIGTVTARIEYAWGYQQWELTPTIDKDGDVRTAYWFDESRVEFVSEGSKVPEERPAGFLAGGEHP